jgi:hypothetical protein
MLTEFTLYSPEYSAILGAGECMRSTCIRPQIDYVGVKMVAPVIYSIASVGSACKHALRYAEVR